MLPHGAASLRTVKVAVVLAAAGAVFYHNLPASIEVDPDGRHHGGQVGKDEVDAAAVLSQVVGGQAVASEAHLSASRATGVPFSTHLVYDILENVTAAKRSQAVIPDGAGCVELLHLIEFWGLSDVSRAALASVYSSKLGQLLAGELIASASEYSPLETTTADLYQVPLVPYEKQRATFTELQETAMTLDVHIAQLTHGFLAGHAHGLHQGAVWYYAGTQLFNPSSGGTNREDWTWVASVLCPNPAAEFVYQCAAAVGHSGWVREAAASLAYEFTPCDDVGRRTDFSMISMVQPKWTSNETIAGRAYMACDAAPSTVIAKWCASGYYDAFFGGSNYETGLQLQFWNLDPVKVQYEQTTSVWMFPCLLPETPFAGECFRNLFMSIAVFKERFKYWEPFKKPAARSPAHLCYGYPLYGEQNILDCIYGLSASILPQVGSKLGLGSSWDGHGTPQNPTDMVGWCSNFVRFAWSKPYDGQLRWRASLDHPWGGSLDEQRWLACVSGYYAWMPSYFWWLEKVHVSRRLAVCEPLLGVAASEWQPAYVREMAYERCQQAVRYTFHSYARGDSADVDDFGIWAQPDNLTNPESGWTYWTEADFDEYDLRTGGAPPRAYPEPAPPPAPPAPPPPPTSPPFAPFPPPAPYPPNIPGFQYFPTGPGFCRLSNDEYPGTGQGMPDATYNATDPRACGALCDSLADNPERPCAGFSVIETPDVPYKEWEADLSLLDNDKRRPCFLYNAIVPQKPDLMMIAKGNGRRHYVCYGLEKNLVVERVMAMKPLDIYTYDTAGQHSVSS